MERRKKGYSFDRIITSVDNHPHIYITPPSEKGERSEDLASFETEQAAAEGHKEETRRSVPFFGHHIGKLLAPDKAEAEEFRSIDRELESSLETVRKKLRRSQARRTFEAEGVSEEEAKHRRFIEERNKAQEALFDDIIRSHREFGTGLTSDDLLSLHDLMKMEADHEEVCSLEESIHELVECDLLKFLRRKAAEQSWGQLEGYINRFRILFPIPSSMEDPAEPARNEKIREERKKSAQDDFFKVPARQLAELILGNVPMWVYSYPAKDTYLWQLTVLQGVTAGLAADFLTRYLAVWEENSSEILNSIQKEFLDKIEQIRQRGESASDLFEVLAVSKELQRIGREQIPDQIWKYMRSKLGVSN